MKGIFVTGTDTGVGKTLLTGCLAAHLAAAGTSVVTQKWVQTGCAGEPEDVLAHLALMGRDAARWREEMPLLCPYVFALAASPHLAAAREGVAVDPGRIESAFGALRKRFETVIVEGAGGPLVPLADGLLTADLAARLGLAAVLVAPNRLGTISATLAAVEALRSRGIAIIGVVMNRLASGGDPAVLEDNPRAIARFGRVPVLGEMPFVADTTAVHSAFAPVLSATAARIEEMRRD